MKRKYYMRGLGAGILATSLIFMAWLFFSGVPMTDAAIRERAAALGMVESTSASGDAGSRTLKELQDQQEDRDPNTTVEVSPDGDVTTTTTKTADPTEKKDDGGDEAKAAASFEDSSDGKEGTSSTGDTTDTGSAAFNTPEEITFTISGGDSSASVGRKLERAGLVSSAEAFDDYLEQNGYDHVIRTGTYTIASGSSYRQIAEAITSR